MLSSVKRLLPRFDNKLRIDYAFSIGLIIAGLTGAVINIFPLNVPIETQASSVSQPQIASLPADALSRSVPTKLEIPSINVSTDLITLGKNADGSLEIPEEYDVAGWYKYSPTPGEIGPAVITGHVDNYLGPAVFYNLKDLMAGALVQITREDGTLANFTVERVEVFEQDNFPTQEVYGNIDHSGLRLITCGGNYDVFSGRYSHNVVVYASFSNS